MEDGTNSLDFIVTLCLGGGDGGDVEVTVNVTDEEYELLRQCCREGIEIEDCEGLEDLCDRIKEAAADENESCMEFLDSDEEIDYDSISYIIGMPSEISDSAEDESEEWEDYADCPFAMEAVNGEIISLTADMQEKMKDRIIEKFGITEEELISWLVDYLNGDESEDDQEDESEDEPENDPKAEWLDMLGGVDPDALAEILGFDLAAESFSFEDIGFLESEYGWEAKELLEELGFEIVEEIENGPHGHGTHGIVYIQD